MHKLKNATTVLQYACETSAGMEHILDCLVVTAVCWTKYNNLLAEFIKELKPVAQTIKHHCHSYEQDTWKLLSEVTASYTTLVGHKDFTVKEFKM